MIRRPVGDYDDTWEAPYYSFGSVTLFNPRPAGDKPAVAREFWIGFHCSAPGPSDAPPGPPVVATVRKARKGKPCEA